jgi:hypothetical protein
MIWSWWARLRHYWSAQERAFRRCGRDTGHRWRLLGLDGHVLIACFDQDAYQARHVCELCRGYRITIIPGDLADAVRKDAKARALGSS